MKLPEFIAHKYGLGDILTFEDAEGGHSGDNKIIKTATSKYFLKEYKDIEAPRIEEIHKIYTYFDSLEIPTVLPLKTSEKADYVELLGIRYALFTFIEAKNLRSKDLSEQNIVDMAKLLSKMHNVVGDTIPDFVTFIKKRKLKIDRFYKVAEQLIKYINALPNKTAFDEENITTIKAKLAYLSSDLDEFEKAAPPNDLILSHRDYQERNILFTSDENALRIVDFDKAGADSRYFEVSRCLMYVFFTYSFSKASFSRARSFLHEYCKKSPLNKKEFRKVLHFCVLQGLLSLWIYQEYYLRDNKRTEIFMPEESLRQSYMMSNLDYFLDTVTGYLS